MIGVDAFIAGRILAYVDNGRRLRAQFRRRPLEHLRITTARGARVAAPSMAESAARTWFAKLTKGKTP